jgi:hypothetical protein
MFKNCSINSDCSSRQQCYQNVCYPF